MRERTGEGIMKKARLDLLVFERGLVESRERAKTTIMAGLVYVNGQRSDKPGTPTPVDAEITIHGDGLPFVSRGGYKLDKALSVFPIQTAGKSCIDCGASTGGFTDVLLQHDAARVYAVDVGYGQLAWKLREDPRVICMERTNVRYVSPEIIGEPLDLAVMDVSFISIKLILPALKSILKKDSDIICLIKPQFEAGKEKVGKKGVVRDPKVHKEVISDILSFCKDQSLCICGLDYSPIKGPEGNIEFLLWLKANTEQSDAVIDIDEVVFKAHEQIK